MSFNKIPTQFPVSSNSNPPFYFVRADEGSGCVWGLIVRRDDHQLFVLTPAGFRYYGISDNLELLIPGDDEYAEVLASWTASLGTLPRPKTNFASTVRKCMGAATKSERLQALTQALKGRKVFFLGKRKGNALIESVMDFEGGFGVHFGGPGRGCDYGDTWVYLSEIIERNGVLYHSPTP